jgi:hypothetical protein
MTESVDLAEQISTVLGENDTTDLLINYEMACRQTFSIEFANFDSELSSQSGATCGYAVRGSLTTP